MPWQLIDPKYYSRQIGGSAATQPAGNSHTSPSPHKQALWYQDTTVLGAGELVLEVDDGQVSWFQLSHTNWPRGNEHIVEWHSGGVLLAGEIPSEDEDRRFRHSSPTVRHFAAPPRAIVLEMVDYFLAESGALAEAYRETVARVLWEALQRTAEDEHPEP